MTAATEAPGPLLLRLRRYPGPPSDALFFDSAEVAYLGDDVYRFRGNRTAGGGGGGGGEPVELRLLSRTAAAEFLDLVLRQEHEAELGLEGGVRLAQLEDVSAPALARCLLLLRDARF
jgi:hypothetical protein